MSRENRADRGASLVEYVLLVGLIAVVAIGAVTLLGTTASNQMNNASTGIAGVQAS